MVPSQKEIFRYKNSSLFIIKIKRLCIIIIKVLRKVNLKNVLVPSS